MNAKHAAKIAAHKESIRRKTESELHAQEHAMYIANHPDEFCAYCHAELDDDNGSGFCSVECERNYGECPDCGAPSRGNRLCPDCREY